MGETLSKKRQTQITATVSQQQQFPFMPDEDKRTLDVMVMFLPVRFPPQKGSLDLQHAFDSCKKIPTQKLLGEEIMNEYINEGKHTRHMPFAVPGCIRLCKPTSQAEDAASRQHRPRKGLMWLHIRDFK